MSCVTWHLLMLPGGRGLTAASVCVRVHEGQSGEVVAHVYARFITPCPPFCCSVRRDDDAHPPPPEVRVKRKKESMSFRAHLCGSRDKTPESRFRFDQF